MPVAELVPGDVVLLEAGDRVPADLRLMRARGLLIEEAVLPRGAVYPLLPPDDIHRIETVGDQPSYSLHVLGADLSRQHRHIYDPATGKATAIDGQGM